MTKNKKKAALAIIMASIVLLVVFPQYGLAAVTQTITNPETQTTVSTPSSFSLTASPAKLYIVVGENFETSRIRVSTFKGTVDLEVLDVDGIISMIEPKTLTLNNEVGYATLSVKAQPKFEGKTVDVIVKATSGSIEKTVKVTVTVLQPNFRITASPSVLYLEAGKAGTANINLYSVDRFNGTIALSASTPAGWTTPLLAKNELTLAYPTKSSTTLSVTVPADAKTGNYIITVTGEYQNHGKSDDITHSVNVTVQVIKPDFKVYASPTVMYLLKGTSQDSIIRVYSVGRFNGSVSLTVSEIVHPDGGSLTETFNATSLSILYNKLGAATLSITVPAAPKYGKYVIQVTATGDYLGTSLEHSVNVTVQVINPELAIYSSASLLSIPAGKSVNATIRVMSLGRLNDTITITATDPSGLTTKIYNSSLDIAYNRSNSTVVTISVPAGAESGKYIVEFKGQGTTPTLADTTSIKIVVP